MENWFDDKKNPLNIRRQRGRPEVNPFPSEEMEKDFAVRGHMMLEQYYDYSDPNTKNNFVFDDTKRMSKSQFWSVIYIYYTKEKGLVDNLQGYVSALVKHFGLRVTCDRTTLSKCISMLNDISVTSKHIDLERTPESKIKARMKYRSRYLYVAQLWEGLL